MSDHRKNLQVVQPNMEYPPDNNGWPEPLTDPSSPLGIKVTNGRNGESSMNSGNQTSQQARGETKGGETAGSSGNTKGPGALSGPLSTPETYHGDDHTQPFTGSDRADITGTPHTSQQKRGEHKLPEGR